MTPRVNLVRPATGWSAGGTLVQIDGEGFQMPAAPAQTTGAPVPAPSPPVAVLFDGIPSPHVEVISPTIMRCVTPRHPPDRSVNNVLVTSGTVAVVVNNLDEFGALIPGETFTVPDGFTFVRPVLGTKQVRGTWLCVVDAFMEHWRSICLENVAWNPSVDYDADTGDTRGYVEMADLPGIAVTRVTFPDSDTEPEGGPVELEAADETILLRRPPMASDITFTLVLVSNNQGELVNLAEVVKSCFRDASTFQVLVDPSDPTHGTIDFSFVLTAPITISERIGISNVVTAEAPGVIFRVLSADLPGAPVAGLPGVPAWIPHQGTRAVTRPAKHIRMGAGPKRSS